MASNEKFRPNNYNSQLKTEIYNLKKELGEFKTDLYAIKQFFDSEKPGYTWDKVKIFFKDGSNEVFTNVIIKKYTYEANNTRNNKTYIEKSSVKYIVCE